MLNDFDLFLFLCLMFNIEAREEFTSHKFARGGRIGLL